VIGYITEMVHPTTAGHPSYSSTNPAVHGRELTSPPIPKGTQRARAPNERGRKDMQFSASKSPQLRNGARCDQGYNDGLIGSRIRAFDWY